MTPPPTNATASPFPPTLSTPSPATRAAAWRSRPAPARARPGCWCRASCARCSMARTPRTMPTARRASRCGRMKSWPSPSPRRPPAKCASGLTSGCKNSPMPTTRPCARNCIMRGVSSQKSLQSNADMRRQLSNLYRSMLASGRLVQIRTFHSWFAALLRSAPRGRAAPAGHAGELRVARRRRPGARAGVAPLLCGAGQGRAAARPTSRRWCWATAASRPTRRCSPRWTSAPSSCWPMKKAWSMRRCSLSMRSSRSSPGWTAPEQAAGHADGPANAGWTRAPGAGPRQQNKTFRPKALRAVSDALTASRPDLSARCDLLRKALFGRARSAEQNLVGIRPPRRRPSLSCRRCAGARLQHDAWLHQQRMARLSRAADRAVRPRSSASTAGST